MKLAYGGGGRRGRRAFWVERVARTEAWSKGECDAVKCQ